MRKYRHPLSCHHDGDDVFKEALPFLFGPLASAQRIGLLLRCFVGSPEYASAHTFKFGRGDSAT